MRSGSHTFTTNNNYNNLLLVQLNTLDQAVDWDDLVKDIFPYYVKSDIQNIELTVESMFRIYILSRHFETPPEAIEKALFQVEALRNFALIDLDRDQIPNAECITNFSSILFERDLMFKIEEALRMDNNADNNANNYANNNAVVH